MISESKAREIAGMWYTGQWAALYKVASCQDYAKLSRQDWMDARYEAQKEAVYCIHRKEKKNSQELSALADWIRFVAEKHGKPVEGCLV